VEQCYLPAAAAYRGRAQNNGALAVQISTWRHTLEHGWPTLRFGRVLVDTGSDQHLFSVLVQLGELNADSGRVELYADPRGDTPAFRQVMTRLDGQTGAAGMPRFAAQVPATRAAEDYTARIVPAFPGVSVPLESGLILWQR
jgi:starch phosphorylase